MGTGLYSNHESGQVVLIAVILSLSVAVLILFGLSLPVADQIRNAGDYLSSKQTLINSESLNDEVLYRLNNGKNMPAVLNMSVVGESSYSVIAEWNANTKQVVSNSDYRGFTRKIEAVFTANRTIIFDFGVWLGSGGLRMENSSRIDGNVFSVGNVLRLGSSSVGGQLSTSTSPVNLPMSDNDIDNWKIQASSGKIINGNVTITNSSATTTAGALKIVGNLTISNSSVMTLNGPLYVTGNLVLDNSAKIQLSPSYGNKSETVVVNGIINLGNSTYFGGSGQHGSTIILATQSTSGCSNTSCTGGTPAISLSNSAEANAILVAPHGAVYLSNSAQTKSVFANYLHMSNSAHVEYDPYIVNTNFKTSTTTTSWSISSLKEI
jgi:hypothetical protein